MWNTERGSSRKYYSTILEINGLLAQFLQSELSEDHFSYRPLPPTDLSQKRRSWKFKLKELCWPEETDPGPRRESVFFRVRKNWDTKISNPEMVQITWFSSWAVEKIKNTDGNAMGPSLFTIRLILEYLLRNYNRTTLSDLSKLRTLGVGHDAIAYGLEKVPQGFLMLSVLGDSQFTNRTWPRWTDWRSLWKLQTCAAATKRKSIWKMKHTFWIICRDTPA